MSLDVYLVMDDPQPQSLGSGIWVRENGQRREISRAEWDEKHPDQEPIVFQPDFEENNEVFSANITHNLNTMAGEAEIYEALWRPEEMLAPEIAARLRESEKTNGHHHDETKAIEATLPTVHASDLIEPLRKGLALLESEPERFKAFNPSNGWGSYDVFVPWVREYLEACERYPMATVRISR